MSTERDLFEEWWSTGAGNLAGNERGWLGAAWAAWQARAASTRSAGEPVGQPATLEPAEQVAAVRAALSAIPHGRPGSIYENARAGLRAHLATLEVIAERATQAQPAAHESVEDAYFRGINEGLRMAAESTLIEERLKKPPCVECGAMTLAEANDKCRCAGDKDDCHGCRLWPDDPEEPATHVPVEPPPLPAGEVMASGVVGGVPVSLVRYTEADIRRRDGWWQYEVQKAQDAAKRERAHRLNLVMELERALEGEPSICSFPEVERVRAALATQASAPSVQAIPKGYIVIDKELLAQAIFTNTDASLAEARHIINTTLKVSDSPVYRAAGDEA